MIALRLQTFRNEISQLQDFKISPKISRFQDLVSDSGISAKISHRISNAYEGLQISRLHKISGFYLRFHSMCTKLQRVTDHSIEFVGLCLI